MGFSTNFLYQKLVLFVGNFWVSLSTYFLPLFGFFRAYFFRFKRDDTGISSKEKNQNDSNCVEPKPGLQPQMEIVAKAEQDSIDLTNEFGQKEAPGFSFQFKFPTYDEFSRRRREVGDSIIFQTAQSMSITKDELMPIKGSNGSIEESEVVSFDHPKELNSDDGLLGDKDNVSDGFSSDEDFVEINLEVKDVHEEVLEKVEPMAFTEEKVQPIDKGKNNLEGDHDEVQLHFEKESLDMDSVSESSSSSPLRSVMNCLIDSYSDGFLSDGDFGGEMSDFDETHVEDLSKEHKEGEFNEGDTFTMEELRKLEEAHFKNVGNLKSDFDETHLEDSSKEHKEGDFDEGDTFTVEELGKLEEAHFKNVGKLNSDFLSEKDFHGEKDNSKDKQAKMEDDSEDSNKLETLWEHQELIEQLKMELKKVRATGLPTILEESEESPKIMEDLKPWKIDEKFQRVDRMDELHKFYKSYRDRMRKFDIFNYQKMYAIGFLQLKDPLQSIPSTEKPSAPSLLSEIFSLCKRGKIGNDPTMKFVKELQSDLEVVYVGQMCLSWEILHWQYGKALELWESDHRGIRQYNEIAGEFQQFQVLVQRFIENEPFQGPRVQNYVKSRCFLRNLLQVPVIREDSKDRKKAMKSRERGDYAITSDMLIEIMEESIRIFWRFVRADKDSSNVIVRCRKGPNVELQDPADTDLLMEVRTNLQKKEKKLRDLLRSGNCILKRFQKRSQEDDSDQVLYFFSQVDLKLVRRVLNMSRVTTDQLVWCRNKLTNISFVNRKIRVQPSFLLFPC